MSDVQQTAQEAAQWFETARRATGYTETGPREDGERYVRTKNGAPEWVRDLVYEAHGGDFLPDDWRYATIRAALEWIAEGNDDTYPGPFADDMVDVYTGERFAWLASNLSRAGYVDEAVSDYGEGRWPEGGIVEAVGLGQYAEASEIFDLVMQQLEARIAEEAATVREP